MIFPSLKKWYTFYTEWLPHTKFCDSNVLLLTGLKPVSGAAGLPAFPFGPTSQIPGMNLYFVVNMEPTSHNETFNTLKIGLEVQACLNHSALANANVRKSKELGKEHCCHVSPRFPGPANLS